MIPEEPSHVSRSETGDRPARTRREPPPFRHVAVRRVADLSPWMRRVTLAGPELEGLSVDLPAASVRLLLPSRGTTDLVVPTWNGNEFLLGDGTRPVLRTFTPRRLRPGDLELDLDMVLHESGAASDWARAAGPGDRAAVSGPGRGYQVDPEATSFLLAGDESAMPAIGQLLESLPGAAVVDVHLEVAHPDARVDFPDHPGALVSWHDLPSGEPTGTALLAAVRATDLAEGTRVWVAGEAAAVQRIRRHLFEELGLERSAATIRGYWKYGRDGT